MEWDQSNGDDIGGVGHGEAGEGAIGNTPVCVLQTMCRLLQMGDCHSLLSQHASSLVLTLPTYDTPAIASMLSVFALLGTLGNGLVLAVYVRKPNKTNSTIFIICLAATDFVTSCLVMPFTVTMEALNYVIVYDALCKVYYFLITCSVPFAALVMVAIAVDRYLSICRPHCRLLDARRSQMWVTLLAVVSALLGVLTALFHGVYIREVFPVKANNSQIILNTRKGFLSDMRLSDLTAICGNSSSPDCEDETRDAMITALDNLTVVSISQCRTTLPTAVIYTGQCRHNQLLLSTAFRKTYQKVYAVIFLVCFLIVFGLYIAIYRSVLLRRSRRLRAKQRSGSCFGATSSRRDVSVTDSNHTSCQDVPLQNINLENVNLLNPNVQNGNLSVALLDVPLQNSNHQNVNLLTVPLHNVHLQNVPLQNGLGAGSGRLSSASNVQEEIDRLRLLAKRDSRGVLKEKYLVANIRTALMLFVVTVVFILAFLPSWLMAHGVVPFHAVVFYTYFAYNVCNPIIYAFMNPTFRKDLQDLGLCRAVRHRRYSAS